MVCRAARSGLFLVNLHAPNIFPTVDSAKVLGRYASSFARAEFTFDDSLGGPQGWIKADVTSQRDTLFHAGAFGVVARNGSIDPLQGAPG